jgi:hypothetical protein
MTEALSVSQLLEASRAQHNRAREARHQGLAVGARASLEIARDLRVRAHELDPAHADPAWALDTKPTHAEYMDFYTRQLARGR